MLPKRSTYVDQNIRSQSVHSQLSVAIFMASRTHLRTQECMILGFYPQIRHNVALDPTNLGFCLIYYRKSYAIYSKLHFKVNNLF